MNASTRHLKQQIFSTLIVFFVLGMVFTTMEVSQAANQANTNLLQNITAGALSITAQNTSIAFNNTSAGYNTHSLMNMNNVQVTDYRGSNSDSWAVTTESIGNFVSVDDSSKQFVLSNIMYWTPGGVTALNGASATGVSAGSAQYLNAQRTLISATSGNGDGAYQIDNTILNYLQRPSDPAGNYTTTLTLTAA